jgi:hypothetical protein
MDKDKLKDVRYDLLKAFQKTVVETLEDLEVANKQHRVHTVAWLTRNLLELGIWIEYCATSSDHAKEFVLDSARDAHDAMDIPDGVLGTNHSLKEEREKLVKQTRDDGFETLDEKYKSVSSAAKELGKAEAFKHSNKLLSKFAHPTALHIVSSTGSSKPIDYLIGQFYKLGTGLGQGELRYLDQAMKSLSQSK